ncbi:MAG: CvpA family protein [Pseudomonadota bacterium]
MIIDIVVAAIIIISAIISFLRGFIREILTIAGIVGGLAAAYFIGPHLAPTVQGWFGVDPNAETTQKLWDLVPLDILASVTAYAIIFIVFVIVISVISHFTASAVKAMGLGPVDRTLGVIFGIGRAVILLGLLYLPFHLLMDAKTKDDVFKESRTHVVIEKTAMLMSNFLPSSKETKERIEQVANEADKSLKDKLLEQDLLQGSSEEVKNKVREILEEAQTGYMDKSREELEALFEEKMPEEIDEETKEIIKNRLFETKDPTFNE